MRTTTGIRTRAVHHRLALAGLAGAVAIGITACGGSGTSASGGSATSLAGPAAASSAPSSAAPSAAKPSSSRSSAPAATPGLAELASRVTAAAQAKGTARLVSTSSGAAGARSTGAVRFRGSAMDFAVTSKAAGRTVQMVFIGGAMYMNVGEKYQGKSWLRIAPGGSDPLSKTLAPLLTQLSGSLDLKAQLTGSKDSKITGAVRTELAGVPATRYTLVTSEKALLAQFDKIATTAEMRKALRSQFKGARAESVLWIGDDGLPLRVDSRVVGAAVPGTTTTVTYSDWGKPVRITAPPRSDIIDLAS